MNGRLSPVLAFATAALLITPVLSSRAELSAQDAQGRFRVMVPRFIPDQGTNDGFGKDTAERIRRRLDALPTHSAIEEKVIEEAFKRFDMKYEDVLKGPDPCTQLLQLGRQLNTEVALCAKYRKVDNDNVEVYDIAFWQLQTNQSFEIQPFTIDKDDDEEAADHILEEFDRYVEQQSFRTYCYEYAQSQDWESSLRNCNQALEINPSDVGVLAQRAYVYQQQDELEKSLADLKAVLAIDPVHETALQRAGYVATVMGDDDEGREYYSQYLELNPGDVHVRRTIAFDSYEAGDPKGAMLLIEQGLGDTQDIGLLTDLGNYAFAAAREVAPDSAMAQGGGNQSTVTPEAAELYHTAVDAFMKVYEMQPDSLPVSALQNVIAAYAELGETDEAIAVGQRVTQTHPEEASLWSTYGSALRRAGRLDEALDAMTQVEEINPEYPNLYALQGVWLLEANRPQDAVPYLKKAVQRGQDPDMMARQLLARANNNGIRQENYQYAIDLLKLAKESFDVSPDQLRELNFWQGFSLFTMASKIQEARTVETARRTLPMFEEAKRLLGAARGYQRVSNLDQYLTNADTYIEIQQAIIRRGGG